MRPFAVAAAVLLAVPAFAQSHLSDSSGVYVGVQSYPGPLPETGASIGIRRANGVDYGISGSIRHSDINSGLTVAPQAGYTRRLGDRTFARLDLRLAYSRSAIRDDAFERLGYRYSGSGLALDASAGLGRSYRLGGSFAVRPSLGVFVEAGRTLSWEQEGLDSAQDLEGDTYRSAGLRAELPLTFRLFGTDAAVTSTYSRPVGGEWGARFTPRRDGLETSFRINL